MSLAPKSFHKLLPLHFIIPAYQRGYRWDKQQVTDLLHDLHVFYRTYCKSTTSDAKVPYYCLQPIAVVKDKKESDTYSIVDGQQRLTTIYLLLHFFKKTIKFINFQIYDISLPSRDIQEDYLKNLRFQDDNADYTSNIDNFYLRQAYKAIEEWYNPNGPYVIEMYDILKLFLEQPGVEDPKDVRVIWYEIVDESPLEAFRNLNYGKIPLTSTELVKALLLQGEKSPLAGEHLRGAAYRRALEWDRMEHALHNPDLWAMLADSRDESLSHIEIVLDFVADRLNNEMWKEDKEKAEGNGSDPNKVKSPFERKSQEAIERSRIQDNFNYYVVDEYLRRHGNDAIEGTIWREIRTIFNLIQNWYDNRQWYHLIGLYRLVQKDKKNVSRRKFLREIYGLATKDGKNVDRSEFTESLRKKIGDAIRVKDDKIGDLKYGEDNPAIIRILEAVNVKTAMDDATENNRFAFDAFDLFKVTSLEHIHPQNITDDAAYDDFKAWKERRSKDFQSLRPADFVNIARVRAGGANIDDEALRETANGLKSEAEAALASLEELTKTKKDYEANKQQIAIDTRTFDRLFGDLAGISEAELHGLGNMALVDKDTNSALQNYFLDRKRGILMEEHAKCNPKTREGTYAPPATRAVFSKHYSRSNPGDMRLWTKDDRRNYFAEIQKIYSYFTR